jgi:hypothetical protein
VLIFGFFGNYACRCLDFSLASIASQAENADFLRREGKNEKNEQNQWLDAGSIS